MSGWRLSAYTISLPHMTPEQAVKAVRAAGYRGVVARSGGPSIGPLVDRVPHGRGDRARRQPEGRGVQVSGDAVPGRVGRPVVEVRLGALGRGHAPSLAQVRSDPPG